MILVGNKADSQVDRYRADELYRLGLGDPLLISALQGTDTGDLLDRFVAELPENGAAGTEPAAGEVSVAIIGRPNTGKSSLLNGLVGSERALVSPVAGTTRDVVDTVVSLDGRKIRLVDTAGIRRRGIVTENVERYSLLRSLRALQRSDVGLLVIDASRGRERAGPAHRRVRRRGRRGAGGRGEQVGPREARGSRGRGVPEEARRTRSRSFPACRC